MRTTRITLRALAAVSLFAGFGLTAHALPPLQKADDMARVMPKQAGVDVAVIAAADLARCRVEPYPSAEKPVGCVLIGADGKPARRFIANGTANFNILSFYLNGEEVYRETDTAGKGVIDHYRWLGASGGKIGRDVDGNGTIDVWDSISAEETTKEAFEALAAKDVNKFKALLATEADLKTLGLPASEIARLGAKIAAAPAKFTTTANALAATKAAKWVHAELQVPRTTPADAFGGAQDYVRHANANVLYEKGDNKNAEFISTGEIIRIGAAWKLIDAPSLGAGQPNDVANGEQRPIPENVKPLLTELSAAKDAAGRAAVLEKIVAALVNTPDQETWLRQLIDTYATLAEGGDAAAAGKLTAWKAQIEKFMPKTPIHAFAILRTLNVDYAAKLKTADNPVKVAEVQKWWVDELGKFVAAFPNVEETPEALYRLGMAIEFNGKDGEAAAKQYYGQLAKNFGTHPLAAQAAGAVNRLESEGKPFALAGTNLATGKAFDPAAITGKVTLVYFWGSFAAQGGGLKIDSTFLADLAKKHSGKIEIVTVNLDANPQAAVPAINAVQLPGTHLSGGTLASSYGIMGQHLFLIGKDGKVVNKNASIPAVADEVEKLLK